MDSFQSGYVYVRLWLMIGWFMDYFLGVPGLKQSYLVKMRELAIWPPNLETGVATIPGTGDEQITWTSGRDTAKAMVKLLQIPRGEWVPHTYIAGETSTWNKAIEQLEEYHGICSLNVINERRLV